MISGDLRLDEGPLMGGQQLLKDGSDVDNEQLRWSLFDVNQIIT